MNAVARDSFLNIIVGRPFSWSSDDPTVATVSPGGLVTALAEGVAHVQAQMDRAYAVTTIKVSVVLAPVASVEVVPGSAKVVVGGLVQLTAVLRDAAGNRLRFRDITWQSGNPAVATVSAGTGGTAVVTDVAAGTVTITATGAFQSTGSTVNASAKQGAGGQISIQARNLVFDAGSIVSAQSEGTGNVGTIRLEAGHKIEVKDSTITPSPTIVSGQNTK